MPEVVVFGISFGFPELSRCDGQIAHVLLTRSPLVYPRRGLTARLACVKHAASVRPEPGSNSPLKSTETTRRPFIDIWSIPASRSQENETVLPKEPSDKQRNRTLGHASADGALQINSSTFSTLLSSQGSNAHHNPASRPTLRGNPTKLTGSPSASQTGLGPTGRRRPRTPTSSASGPASCARPRRPNRACAATRG